MKKLSFALLCISLIGCGPIDNTYDNNTSSNEDPSTMSLSEFEYSLSMMGASDEEIQATKGKVIEMQNISFEDWMIQHMGSSPEELEQLEPEILERFRQTYQVSKDMFNIDLEK